MKEWIPANTYLGDTIPITPITPRSTIPYRLTVLAIGMAIIAVIWWLL